MGCTQRQGCGATGRRWSRSIQASRQLVVISRSFSDRVLVYYRPPGKAADLGAAEGDALCGGGVLTAHSPLKVSSGSFLA